MIVNMIESEDIKSSASGCRAIEWCMQVVGVTMKAQMCSATRVNHRSRVSTRAWQNRDGSTYPDRRRTRLGHIRCSTVGHAPGRAGENAHLPPRAVAQLDPCITRVAESHLYAIPLAAQPVNVCMH